MKESQVAAYLVALRCKGESAEELLGSCRAIGQFSRKVTVGEIPVVDTCGTGGDSSGSFNISTVTAFVTAGAGVKVAKHGNRAVSSRSGSADLFEALGIEIELNPESAADCLEKTGLAFLFAPLMHPAMANVVPARKALGLRTIFNLLGPLNNPAGVKRQVIGVYDHELAEKMAQVLIAQGAEHALLVCGEDGLDEITISGRTRVMEVKPGGINTYLLNLEEYGLKRYPLQEIKSRDAGESARICLQVLNGMKGPHRDVVLINSGAALYVAGRAEDLKEGMELARKAIDSGLALEKLRFLQAYSDQHKAMASGQKGGIAYA